MSSNSQKNSANLFRRAATAATFLTVALTITAFVHTNHSARAADAAAPAGTTLTNEQVGKALDTYGKNTVTSNGHTEYNITVPKGKWNFNIIVSLSPNGKVIWLTNSLAALPDSSKVSTDALANVLKQNAQIGPMFFAVANGSLQLWYPVPNYDLTPESFRADVDALVNTIANTEKLWSRDALTGKTAAVTPAK